MTRASFIQHWRAWVTAAAATVALAVASLNWADTRWDQSDDIGEIRENVEFLTRLALEDRITRLDGRIQLLEAISDLSRDDRQTLHELRLERHQLQRRLERLDR